ncbi:hypothetical protein [Streptomyces sp. I6]|uniref:hypothetical protein n=1 Tax=Streptomyces sp. I6 TaxID=2483113 RepID=UPI0037D9A734
MPDAPDSVLLAAFLTLLHRYSGATDLTVGHDGLPLRVSLEHAPSFRELESRVEQARRDAETHRVPLDLLAGELLPGPDGEAAFFGTAFATAARPADGLPDRVDLLLEAGEGSVRATYATALFDGAAVERVLGHYRTLLADAVARPEAPVGSLALMDEDEYRRVVLDWNATGHGVPAATWPELFAEQVRSRPGAVALVFGTRS